METAQHRAAREDYPGLTKERKAIMDVSEHLQAMGLASTRAKTRVLLTPSLVEAALARLGRRLSLDEQKMVLRAVGDHSKVRWPDWWQAC